jgi:uncharacterized protein YutE (UPF0331/DUF86 family)
MPLNAEEKNQIMQHISFLETEISDFSFFSPIDWKKYNSDRNTRRNLERWVENIVNCSIDVAKILIISEELAMPPTYREILRSLGATPYFDEKFGNELSKWAEVRTIITHDYLDVSWLRIRQFLDTAEPLCKSLIQEVEKLV